jgi:hypothetical protein
MVEVRKKYPRGGVMTFTWVWPSWPVIFIICLAFAVVFIPLLLWVLDLRFCVKNFTDARMISERLRGTRTQWSFSCVEGDRTGKNRSQDRLEKMLYLVEKYNLPRPDDYGQYQEFAKEKLGLTSA